MIRIVPSERSMVRSLPAICGFGRYELLGRLAVGGMAEIYLAREPESVRGAGHRHLVIKRILQHVADDNTFTTMFFDEARLAMRLNHPSIVHIYEFGEEQGSYFLAMEWVDGVALGKLIRRAREFEGIPAPLAVKVIAQVAEALHYAHHLKGDDGQSLGIVHRDVSPQNIMVSYDGAVKLLDFGIAKATIQHTKTGDGQVKGKFAYMSPQQCLGEPIDGRADVFALGVCLYESLTGLPLYHRKTQYETMRAVIEDPVPSIRKYRPELSEELDRIVGVALAKNPDDRFPTAGDMQLALERWLAVQQEVVPARRLTELLEGVFGEDIRRGPMVDSTPFGQSFQQVEGAKLPGESIVDVEAESVPPPVLALPEPAALVPVEVEEANADATIAIAPVSEEDVGGLSSKKALWAVATVFLVLVVLFAGAAWWLLRGTPETVATVPTPELPNPVAMQPVEAPTMEAVAPQPVLPVETMQADPVETPIALGSVRFRSTPSGAAVRFGDRDVPGTTPNVLGDVAPGRYDVTLTREGRRDWVGTIEVTAGEEALVDANLRRRSSGMAVAMRTMEASAEPGRISINTRPWSKVYVGTRLLGTTPIGRAQVPAGSVQLRIVDRDGNEHRRSVDVSPGEDERVFYDLSGLR